LGEAKVSPFLFGGVESLLYVCLMKLFLDIANKLIEELAKHDIKAYIWHAATTGSVYIRFEDCRVGSVRLGNHDGREKLKYKFNIRNDIGSRHKTWIKDNGIWRYFVLAHKWKEIIPVLIQRYQEVQKWEKTKFNYTIPYFKQKDLEKS
jgi:hypothetical protein